MANGYARYSGFFGGSGSSAGVSSINGVTGAVNILPGTGITISTVGQNITINATNTGTVTSVSVVTANGLSGTVTNPTTTPAITLAPTFTGITYSTGTAFQAAVAGNFPTLNQSTTGSAGSVSGTNVITNSNLSQMPADTIKGNNTGVTGNALDLTVAQVNAILPVFTSTLNGLVPFSGGGTVNFLRADGTWQPAGSGSGSVTSVSVVSANGLSGTVATPTTTPAITLAPTFTGITYSTGTAFQAAVAGNFPTLNQSTTGTAANITATSNSTLITLSALSLPFSQLSGQATLAQLPTIGSNTILGNNTGGSTTPIALTVAQVNAILPVFTSSLNGLTPASGGGTTNFLRADGTWTAPGGSSYTFADSLVNTSGTVTLKNDSVSPGASVYYGTNASSVLGYYSLNTGSTATFKVQANGGENPGANNPLILPNVAYDTASGYNISTGQYTVQTGNGGYWRIGATVQTNGSPPGNLYISINGTLRNYISTPDSTGSTGNLTSGWMETFLNDGDIITWVPDTSMSFDSTSYLIATRVSGFGNSLNLGAFGSTPNANGATLTSATLILQPFNSSFAGGVPASGGGTVNYLRADGTWSAPPGTGISRSVNSISTATSAGSAASTDYVYLVSGTTTLTLPTAAGNTNLYTVKNIGVATVTIATTGSQTIDGSASASLPVANTSLDLISDGSNWRIV